MGFDVNHYFGFYFEINHKETTYGYEYRCENEHQFGANQGYSFCPLCAERVHQVEYENGWQYLTHFDVEEMAGLEECTILTSGEVVRENSKYFGLNSSYEGVRVDRFDSDEIYLDLSSMDYNSDLESAMQNEDFKNIVIKLRDTFGESFKIRYGIFTYIM